jgi:hypothetical protein
MSATNLTPHAMSLREEIAQRLDTASLPLAGYQRIFGGMGSNEVCDCCDRFVASSEALCEVEVETATGPKVLFMHLSCFDLWVEESRAREGPLEQ